MKNFKCICCNKEIESLYFESIKAEDPGDSAWNGGIVETMYMPYGSKFDSCVFVFGLCDECIEDKYNNGIIGKKLNDYI